MLSRLKIKIASVIILIGAFGFHGVDAFATPSVSAPVTSSTAIINRIINGTPGMQTVVTGSGVNVSAAADASVAARGLTIPVGTQASASITAGRLAGLAGRAIRFGGFVGIATVVVPWVADRYGISVCPPPQFFCKAGDPVPANPKNGGYSGASPVDSSVHVEGLGSGNAVCAAISTTSDHFKPGGSFGPLSFALKAGLPSYLAGQCLGSSGQFVLNVGYSDATCASGQSPGVGPDGKNSCFVSGPPTTAAEQDLGSAIEGSLAGNPSRVGDLYAAEKSAGLSMFAPTDPVVVTASPASSPVTSSVATVNKPDGSVDTVITETKSDVKPVVTGDTLADTKISYPTTTTTTTTTTNNVTHAVTTTSNVTNNYLTPQVDIPSTQPPAIPVVPLPTSISDPGKADSSEFPTDYNREVTQQSILTKMTDFMKPITAEAPTGDKELDTIKAQIDQGPPIVSGITPEGMGIVNWFPKVPTTACRDPQVPNAIGGGQTAVPICDKVNLFSKFISAVICVFALFGCVREVQAAIKA